MITIVTEQDVAQHRPALIAWAEANGLDPKRIDPHRLMIEQVHGRSVIAYDEFQLDANGRKQVDPDRPDHVLIVHRTRTLRHPLPEGIGQPLCTCTLAALDPACDDHTDKLEGPAE